MFQQYKLRQTITTYDGQSFFLIQNFLSVDAMYYVFQYHGSIVIVYNEHWEYQRSVLLPQAPTSSILANGQIYTSNSNIIKYDKYLNITAHSNDFSGYRGLYFNSTNGLIYSGDCSRNKIKIFNQSLSLVNSFNITFLPCSITEHNQMIVITDQTSGFINFYQNNIFITKILTQCGSVKSVLFDDYNHMIVLCETSYVYIYHTNGSYTGISIKGCSSYAYYMNFDSKDRLVLICSNDIDIYY